MSLNDHCISLGIAELNPEACQQYLETPTNGQNDDNTTVDLPLIEFSVINELTGYIKSNIDEIAKNRENIADIKRIAACALSNAINSKDFNVKALGCKLLLCLCNMKGAQSFGVSNTNSVTTIANILYKISLEEIKIPVKLIKGSTTSINRSKRARDALVDDDVAIENVSDDENDESNRPSRGGQKFRIKSSIFHELMIEMKNSISVFWQRTEDHPLEACYDALTTCYFLATINPNFADSIDVAMSTLVELGSSSRHTMILFYRSIMPALTLAARDQRFPENTRSKNQIHKATVLLVSELMHELVLQDKFDNFTAEDIEEMETKTTLPFPIVCILGAMQRMTVAVVDKAPTRATALTSICHFIEQIYNNKLYSFEAINHYLVFLSKLSKCNKVSHRAYSLEIATSIMSFDWIWDINPSNCENASPSVNSNDQMSVSPTKIQDLRSNEVIIGPKTLILILVGRCDDAAPTVRTRAISAISDLLENLTLSTPKVMAEYLLQLILGVDSINLLDILRNRTCDDKPLVRTKAISAYGAALSKLWPKSISDEDTGVVTTELISLYLTEDDVNVFMECCNDTSVSVRKQAISSLTNLVNCRKNESLLQEAWVVSVLPLVADGESTVQAKFAQCAYDILITSVLAWDEENKSKKSSNGTEKESDVYAWSTCVRIVSSGRSKLLKSCIILMARLGLFSNSGKNSLKNLLRIIKNACVYSLDMTEGASDSIVSRGAWALLEGFIDIPSNIILSDNTTLSTFGADIGSVDFVTKCYKNKKSIRKSSVIDDEELRILRVMDRVIPNMDINEIKYVKSEVMKLLLGMRCEPSAISVLITIMFSISKRLNNEDDVNGGWRDVQDWSSKLLVNAYNILHYKVWVTKPTTMLYGVESNILTASMEHDINSNITNGASPLLTALFTIGELSMMGFSVEDDEINTKKYDNNGEKVPSYTISTVSKVFKLDIPDSITKLVQVLMSKDLPTIDNNSRNNQEIIRAYSFLTIGKLCLREKSKARELINIFLREIQNSSDTSHGSAAVRSNALLVLGDICVRYTSLVEHHVGAMASCLQDTDVLVRRHALVLLTQLLLQDFLKWRGMLLYRFLATGVDNDSDMSTFAKSILKTTLQNKYPDLFVQHFTETIIIFNNYINHPAYVAAASNGSDGDETSCVVTMEGVNLEGNTNLSKRFYIYNMMMEDLSDEQKLTISAKLVQDILSNAVDSLHSVDKSMINSQAFEDVLQDTLLLLQSPYLKLDNNRVDGNEINNEDNDVIYDINPDEHSNAIAKAKTKVLVKMSKQHLISHILPIIMSLKAGLESNRSSLQRSIMEYLVYIMKNNKTEITQVLYNDPTLKAEIEYDLKMYEKMKIEKTIKNPLENNENNLIIDVSGAGGSSSIPLSASKTPSKSSTCNSPAPAVLKSILKENNGGNRTPKDSLKCIMKKGKSDRDLTDRYLSTYNQQEIDTNIGGNKKEMKSRRSWTVVVDGLDNENDENNDDDDVFSPDKKRVTTKSK